MRNQHVWREVTPEGEKREVRAVKFGGRWKLQAKLGRSTEWIYYDRPELTDLLALRDLIWRKYQRRRASHDDVTSLDQLIAERSAAGECEAKNASQSPA